MGPDSARAPQSVAPAQATIGSPALPDHLLSRQACRPNRQAQADQRAPLAPPKIEADSKGPLSGFGWIDQRGSKPYREKPGSRQIETCARCRWKRHPAEPTEPPV